ncbi:hypothetical protein [Paraclostridium bifermentans]|uniref:hypothetical protein n=1 Tax=Paraclostridium bifermentans TaxID=1490 RepID=UPI001C7F1C16|nr:hypothetical protein [Paraclostridium bifermentans]
MCNKWYNYSINKSKKVGVTMENNQIKNKGGRPRGRSTERMNISIKPSTKKLLKACAEQEGLSMSEVLDKLITKHIKIK